ncbi:MAG: GNAT family N-acetyltransferase [Alphaproteobacteria bacterium]|nr:GNAT family N-acetyltransferase [Alphaproteobacteria bacterium]MCW5739292.1 GNAT family N-acetyltransferase [Alphaproteobacteria bacterium]
MSPIRIPSAADEAALLALNNAHAAELSELDARELSRLLAIALAARVIGDAEAFLLTFDQAADYHSPNFLWFRRRYERFAYVDRIVVAPTARRGGHARRLYEEFFAIARVAGHQRVCCEVNSDPPNPVSDAFHARLGFTVCGEAHLPDRGKSVRYLTRAL